MHKLLPTKVTDKGGRVVPHATVETSRVVPKLKEDLIQLKRTEDTLYENTSFDGSKRQTKLKL